MKKSPLNFLGLAQITSGLFGGRNRQPNQRKKYFGGRLNRLERDVKTLMDDRKKTRDDYIGEGQSVLGAPTISIRSSYMVMFKTVVFASISTS